MTSILFLIGSTLMGSIQMHLLRKLKTFSKVFYAFFEFTLNFEYFGKKDNPHSLGISEITDCKIRA